MNTLDGDLRVRGRVIPDALTLPTSSIGNTQFNPADPLGVANQQHQYVKQLAQAFGAAAASERRVLHRVYGATATLLDVKAGVVQVAGGAATVTVDLYKNGVSVLSATITLDNTVTAFGTKTGAFASTALVAGDVLEVVLTAAAGGGTLPQGVFVEVTLKEDAQ